MIVGVGASRVRDLFAQAKAAAPSIVFVDEIDAIGRSRGSGVFSGANDEREQTLNQILTEMDGFDASTGVIVLAATNRPDVLDPALLRPGRFDRRVTIQAPDKEGREQILRVHTRSVPLAPDVDLGGLAATTAGMVGADLANLVNEAALLAARRQHEQLPQEGEAALQGLTEVSEHTRQRVDAEVKRIVGEAHDEAIRLMTEHRERLDSLAEALVRAETLDQPAAYAAAGLTAPEAGTPTAEPALTGVA